MLGAFFRELFRWIPWTVERYGDDLILKDVWATAFGVNDNEDSGMTASGLNLTKHPNFKGVALPMRTSSIRSLRNSPIPFMPFGVSPAGRYRPEGIFVVVEDSKTGRLADAAPVVDIGPSLYTGNAIDLTVGLARFFDSTATANNFKRKVIVKILGGAKYL